MRMHSFGLALAVGLVSALAFWVGWTMINTEPDLAELEEQDMVPAAI